MTRTVYDDTMRHDPVRRAAVLRQIQERQAAFAQAQILIEQATMLLVGLGPTGDDPILDRCIDPVLTAQARMSRHAAQITAIPNDTYIGNKAASGSPIGWVPTLEALCDPSIQPTIQPSAQPDLDS